MRANTKRIIITLVLIISSAVISYYLIPISNTFSSRINAISDKFGILQIYPTKPGGREWFIDMNNPTEDPGFNARSNITHKLDGSWQTSGRLDNGK
jgi:hypothetical protein